MQHQANPFDLKLGAALRKRLAHERKNAELSTMVPGILLGRANEGPEHLMYGYYPATQASDEGMFELFESDGIRFLIPQGQVREMLAGGTLELDEGGQLTLLPPGDPDAE